MHALTIARTEPYVWVSWITKLLAGESSCLWSAWLRAHNQTARPQTDFDLTKWQAEHAGLLRNTAAEHQNQGYKVYTEGQNLFTLKGKVGTLSGKPDLVAVKEGSGLVVDTKTGSPRASDRIQVMIYMWALPKANPAFAGVSFDGRVVYKSGSTYIPAAEIDSDFPKQIGELMRVVCGDEEPEKAPTFRECRFCPVTHEDCGDRVEKEIVCQGETDAF